MSSVLSVKYGRLDDSDWSVSISLIKKALSMNQILTLCVGYGLLIQIEHL